jgi:hypothetical protein
MESLEGMIMVSQAVESLLGGRSEFEELKQQLAEKYEEIKAEYRKALSSAICLEQEETAGEKYKSALAATSQEYQGNLELLKKKILEERFQK